MLFVLQVVLVLGEEIAFLLFLLFVAILVAENLVQSQNIFSASHKGYVGISELMLFLEGIGEQIQLQDDENLDIILPAVAVLEGIDQVVDLVQERRDL